MRTLTAEEIRRLAGRPKARRTAVENFLGSMGRDFYVANMNLYRDVELYRWNAATKAAIQEGIRLASREPSNG